MLRKLYDKFLKLADHPKALFILAIISFTESSFFPIPPDVMLIPMVLAAPTRAWRIAFVCSAASILGGLAGYAIGAGLYESVALPIIEFYHMGDKVERTKALYNEYGAIIVGIAGFSPIPYKVFTISSGMSGLSLPVFITASALSRSARFFLVAWLLKKYGVSIRSFIEKRLGLMTLLFCLIFVLAFAALKFL